MTRVLKLNQYMIREKFWRIFGNKFWFEDVNQKRYGYCEQKRFKIKEDIRIYSDPSKSHEWLKIKQKQLDVIIEKLDEINNQLIESDKKGPESNITLAVMIVLFSVPLIVIVEMALGWMEKEFVNFYWTIGLLSVVIVGLVTKIVFFPIWNYFWRNFVDQIKFFAPKRKN